MKYQSRFLVAGLFLLVFVVGTPHAAEARGYKLSGWIPYWAVTDGTASALKNLDLLDSIEPFVFSVKQDGSLKDLGDLSREDPRGGKCCGSRHHEDARAPEHPALPVADEEGKQRTHFNEEFGKWFHVWAIPEMARAKASASKG